MAQVPAPRCCVDEISTVPCAPPSAARHNPRLSRVSDGAPCDMWCSACTSHCTRTQGCGTVPSVYEQPPIVYVSVERRIGLPAAFTRLFVVEDVTVPPCGHISTLVVVR